MTSSDVAIIDGGGANIASLQYALQRVGARSVLTKDVATIASASHVILPGVGAAAAAMDKLNRADLAPMIANLQQPVLGICLGMQLLATRSAEDNASCIGVYPDHAAKLRCTVDTPVPNMGWCRISVSRTHALLDGVAEGSWFYFVHSFALPVSCNTIATATHTDEFAAVNSLSNFHATQFHPERSAAAGSRLLQNFLAMRA
jgi:glutamine amidotransferase